MLGLPPAVLCVAMVPRRGLGFPREVLDFFAEVPPNVPPYYGVYPSA
jgi:hypothetical protein